MTAHRWVALAVGLLLTACGSDIVLPPAQPLTASAEQLAAIPHLDAGPHAVVRGAAISWSAGGETLRVRVVRPQGEGPFPLVLFSHGFAADIDKYDALLDHWASHGYLSIAPYHADGGGTLRAIFNSIRLGNETLIAARVADMKRVLDHLDALDAIEPGLAARVDRSRIAAAGHSFGAFTAQQLGGAAAVRPETGTRIDGRDGRIRAVVAISPPGEMFGVINRQSWREMDRPMLATTGTWDVDGRFVTDWRQHTLSFETAQPGNNWLLVVEGADHYLGNLICRPERDQPPQTDALRMVNANAVTFLDAFVKGGPAAQAYLDDRPLEGLTGGFARLTRR
jgi:predicted dienelactone hydrolase